MRAISTLPLLAVAVAAQSDAGPYDQCGGMGWTGPVKCRAGYTCFTYNPYYSQCIPGEPSTTTTSTTTTPSPTTTLTTITTTIKPPTSSPSTPSSPIPTTLISPNYWIRAVAPPNYHLYLQPSTPLLPGAALITTGTTAGQFTLTTDGQLAYYRGSSLAPLYLHVENPADKTQRKLATEFKEEKNAYGKFGFQGDTLTWSVGEIVRPNEAAWFVCEGQALFVNTGAYGYNTPAGCADQTIHSYGGATADL